MKQSVRFVLSPEYAKRVLPLRVWLVLLCLIGMLSFVAGDACAAPATVTMKEAELKDFSNLPAPRLKTDIVPAFKEAAFPLEKAANLKEVEEMVGKLTPAQRTALQNNRFLLLPKQDLRAFDSMGLYDEMLGVFEGIGGSADPAYREPWNARFVGPDVFLHALHTFYSKRLEAIEGGELLGAVQFLLEELYANAGALRATASKKSAPSWERLQAQLVVPLILALNCDKSAEPVWTDPDAEPEPETDTLENALKLFKKYSRPFSKRTAGAVVEELKRIYAAEEALSGLLGLSPAYASQSVDYTQFTPRGHYEKNSRSRAYFRSMIWLGQLGWKIGTDEGVADALNFALALSYDRGAPQRRRKVEDPEIPFTTPLEAWSRVMEVSSFFVGYPDAASYPEWRKLLLEKAGVRAFTADTSADAAVVQRIREAAGKLLPSIPHFSALHDPESVDTFCVFPQRFTIPWVITDQLTYKPGVREDVPVLFSSLWVAAVVGNDYAKYLVPKQIPLSLAGLPAGTEEGGPTDVPGDPVPGELVKLFSEAMPRRIDALARRLAAEPETAWFSSAGSAWTWLLSTLVSEYGKGYPLYMQSPLFAAKQLETLLGSYTELRHDTILYEKPNYAEMGDGGWEDPPAPLVKGFVEPNLPFWNEMIRVVEYIAHGFEKNGIFPMDTEEYGTLTMFRETLERCAELAEKTLTGVPLTEEEYEFLRLFPLDYMATPADGYGTVVTDELFQSGLIVDIQTVNLSPIAVGSAAVLYQATAEPDIMLVLVGNENSPRITVGMAFNHREFVAPHGRRITDSVWKKRVYGKYDDEPTDLPLPAKNFWYEGLRP